jgi:DNA polymerase-4
MQSPPRKIIHIDMDCFYAAVEVRDNPQLQGKPVAVGGLANRRGVLTTCNYQARRFGLHSAMATYRALKLCPELVLLPVNMEKYRQVSQQVRQIFTDYTDLIEPLSLDEAYLDVTHCPQHQGSATRIAHAIRQKITQNLSLTASAGVAPNKFLAKIASDWHKPNGQFVITPKQVDAFMQPLPVKKLFGVGKVTAKKLAALNVDTCGDLQRFAMATLLEHFGRFGKQLYYYARGIDERAVNPNRIRKSVSVELTYPEDLDTLEACLAKLPELLEKLLQRLQPHQDRTIHKQWVKVKFDDFGQTTMECISTAPELIQYQTLLKNLMARSHKPVRLIGIGVAFEEHNAKDSQLILKGF